MRKKTWVELSDPEKIEDLRRDVVRLFEIVNSLVNDTVRVFTLAQQGEKKVAEVQKELKALAARFPEDPSS